MNSEKLPDDFHPAAYLEINPDVAAARVDPAEHYLRFGRSEGRNYKRSQAMSAIPESGNNIDLINQETYDMILTNFSQCSLFSTTGERDPSRLIEQATDAACLLLSSSQFSSRPVSFQAEIIKLIHNTLMSRPASSLFSVAEMGLRRLRSILLSPELNESDLCRVYDAIHAMYFAGTTDVRDLRRLDSIVPAVERWLYRNLASPQRPSFSFPPSGFLTVAYLIHTGHLDRGNAVTPLIISLARMHAARGSRRIIIYLVQYAVLGFDEEISKLGVEIRNYAQGDNYDRIDEIAAAIKEDKVDVIITEQNRAIAAALFVRRVAPVQMWLDTGFPFWDLSCLDWRLAPALGPGSVLSRTSRITWRQFPETLKQAVDVAEISSVRARYPADRFFLGVFVRLVKLDERFLSFIKKVLDSNPRFYLILAGSGDASDVENFIRNSEHVDRISFIAGNVDLNVYAQAIDVMCDTFPFIGGNACREVIAHGTPVVSKLGTPWDDVLHSDRSLDLLAKTEDEYINLLNRLEVDRDFLQTQKKISLKMAADFSDPTRMIDDVEGAINSAIADRN